MTDFRRLIALVEAASTKVLSEAFWGMSDVENYDNTVSEDAVEIFVNPSYRELLSLGPPLRGKMGSSKDETLGQLFCWDHNFLHGHIMAWGVCGYNCLLAKDYISFSQDDAHDLMDYARLNGVPVDSFGMYSSDLPERLEKDPALKHELDTQLSLLRRIYGRRLKIMYEAT